MTCKISLILLAEIPLRFGNYKKSINSDVHFSTSLTLYNSFDIPTISVAVKAHKYCELNGTWFRHPESNQIWSNYTTCVNLQDLSVSYFLMYLTTFAYKINWLFKGLSAFTICQRHEIRILPRYKRIRIKGMRELRRDLKNSTAKTIGRCGRKWDGGRGKGFIPLGNTYVSPHARVLGAFLVSYEISPFCWHRAFDSTLYCLKSHDQATRTCVFSRELISFERTGRVCWNIWKTRTLHPTGYYLFCIATLHRGAISAITRPRNLPYDTASDALFVWALPIFRPFRVMTLRWKREGNRKKRETTFLVIYFRRIDFSSLQLSRDSAKRIYDARTGNFSKKRTRGIEMKQAWNCPEFLNFCQYANPFKRLSLLIFSICRSIIHFRMYQRSFIRWDKWIL